MSEIANELLEVAGRLEAIHERFRTASALRALDQLEQAAKAVGEAHSGSWLGYHANVYYEGFRPPPAGADFSVEWGLMGPAYSRGSVGDWQQYAVEDVNQEIFSRAGNPNHDHLRDMSNGAAGAFKEANRDLLSLFTTALAERQDPYLSELSEQAKQQKLVTKLNVVNALAPSGSVASRDSEAMMGGQRVPPHINVYAEARSLRSPAIVSEELAGLAKSAAKHLQRWERSGRQRKEPGTNIFIGHGQSLVWRDLKDFLQDRLGLPWDEFNRVPVAGVTNIARLAEMLDNAAIAFLIMTAEDEQADGKLHARMNVVHEAGLFQGRLGFSRAIILLEEGCEEFSNIQGLGQIRFPKGNLAAKSEDIRRVLEREGILTP